MRGRTFLSTSKLKAASQINPDCGFLQLALLAFSIGGFILFDTCSRTRSVEWREPEQYLSKRGPPGSDFEEIADNSYFEA